MPPLPSRDQINQLPLLARIAFVARCGWRLLPWLALEIAESEQHTERLRDHRTLVESLLRFSCAEGYFQNEIDQVISEVVQEFYQENNELASELEPDRLRSFFYTNISNPPTSSDFLICSWTSHRTRSGGIGEYLNLIGAPDDHQFQRQSRRRREESLFAPTPPTPQVGRIEGLFRDLGYIMRNLCLSTAALSLQQNASRLAEALQNEAAEANLQQRLGDESRADILATQTADAREWSQNLRSQSDRQLNYVDRSICRLPCDFSQAAALHLTVTQLNDLGERCHEFILLQNGIIDDYQRIRQHSNNHGQHTPLGVGLFTDHQLLPNDLQQG